MNDAPTRLPTNAAGFQGPATGAAPVDVEEDSVAPEEPLDEPEARADVAGAPDDAAEAAPEAAPEAADDLADAAADATDDLADATADSTADATDDLTDAAADSADAAAEAAADAADATTDPAEVTRGAAEAEATADSPVADARRPSFASVSVTPEAVSGLSRAVASSVAKSVLSNVSVEYCVK